MPHTQHDDVYWVQLYNERGQEPEGNVVKIRPSSSDVDVADLIEMVAEKLKLDIGLHLINVYPSGTRSFSQDKAFHPGDPVVLASTTTSSRDPLIVIASEWKKDDYNNDNCKTLSQSFGKGRSGVKITIFLKNDVVNSSMSVSPCDTSAEATVSLSRASSELTTTTIPTGIEKVETKLEDGKEVEANVNHSIILPSIDGEDGEEILKALDMFDDGTHEGAREKKSDSILAQESKLDPYHIEGRCEPLIAHKDVDQPVLSSANVMGQDQQCEKIFAKSTSSDQELDAKFHGTNQNLDADIHGKAGKLQLYPFSNVLSLPTDTNQFFSNQTYGRNRMMREIEEFQIDKNGCCNSELFPKIYQILAAIYKYADLNKTREYNNSWLIPSRKSIRLAIEMFHGRVFGQSKNSTDKAKVKKNITNIINRYKEEIEFDHKYIIEKIEEANNILDVPRPSRMILDVDPILNWQIVKCSNYKTCKTIIALSLNKFKKAILCKKCQGGDGILTSSKKRRRDNKDFTEDNDRNDYDYNNSSSGNSSGGGNSSSRKDDDNDAQHNHKYRNKDHYNYHNDDDSNKSSSDDETDNDDDNRKNICNRKESRKGKIDHFCNFFLLQNSAATRGCLEGDNETQECSQSLIGTSVNRDVTSNLSNALRTLAIKDDDDLLDIDNKKQDVYDLLPVAAATATAEEFYNSSDEHTRSTHVVKNHNNDNTTITKFNRSTIVRRMEEGDRMETMTLSPVDRDTESVVSSHQPIQSTEQKKMLPQHYGGPAEMSGNHGRILDIKFSQESHSPIDYQNRLLYLDHLYYWILKRDLQRDVLGQVVERGKGNLREEEEQGKKVRKSDSLDHEKKNKTGDKKGFFNGNKTSFCRSDIYSHSVREENICREEFPYGEEVEESGSSEISSYQQTIENLGTKTKQLGLKNEKAKKSKKTLFFLEPVPNYSLKKNYSSTERTRASSSQIHEEADIISERAKNSHKISDMYQPDSFEHSLIEVAPGIEMPLRGSKETQHAINNGYIMSAQCVSCTLELNCIRNSEYVLCALCHSITPLEVCGAKLEPTAFGVGLGFIE